MIYTKEELRERIQSVLDDMPKDQPPRGNPPKWGNLGAKPRAFYLARVMGMTGIDEKCPSCDADVYDRLLNELKESA